MGLAGSPQLLCFECALQQLWLHPYSTQITAASIPSCAVRFDPPAAAQRRPERWRQPPPAAALSLPPPPQWSAAPRGTPGPGLRLHRQARQGADESRVSKRGYCHSCLVVAHSTSSRCSRASVDRSVQGCRLLNPCLSLTRHRLWRDGGEDLGGRHSVLRLDHCKRLHIHSGAQRQQWQQAQHHLTLAAQQVPCTAQPGTVSATCRQQWSGCRSQAPQPDTVPCLLPAQC